MRKLIVTADDFGMAPSINEGIARACSEGIVTNTSLTPAGEAFDDAVRLAKKLGLREAGAHLALTEVKQGFHRHHKDLLIDMMSGRVGKERLYSELKSQLESAISTGIKITSLSSHEHIHMFPAVRGMFIRLAKEYGVGAIRYLGGDRPASIFDPAALYRSAILGIFSPGMRRAFDLSGLKHNGCIMGFIDSGRIGEDVLIRLMCLLKDGTTELICHPGFLSPEVLSRYPFHVNCESELAALTGRRVRRLITASGVKLMKFSEGI